MSEIKRMPRWPLYLIAAPAAVAVWSGWVGLGQLCGFGVIHPLPGIWDAARLNTAITLPIGVEAYGAYALAAWLTPGTSERARRFARWSALGALVLGMAGQVAYHLLSAAHAARAPWPVVTLVACLPVAVMGLGTALAHLIREPDEHPATVTTTTPESTPGTVAEAVPATAPEEATYTAPVSATETVAGPAPGRARRAGQGKRAPKRAAQRGQVTPQDAEAAFAALLARGGVPSLRAIRRELPVGEPKAKMLRAHLESILQEQAPAFRKAA